MSYYVRALLTEWEPQPLDELLEHARQRGCELRPERSDTATDDAGWAEVDLRGPGSTSPVTVEIALDDGDPHGLVREEVKEFHDELHDAEASQEAIEKVRDHLTQTRAIVAVRLPASDAEAAADAAEMVLDYYAQRPGVLFQMDADGFYDGDERIVEL